MSFENKNKESGNQKKSLNRGDSHQNFVNGETERKRLGRGLR